MGNKKDMEKRQEQMDAERNAYYFKRLTDAIKARRDKNTEIDLTKLKRCINLFNKDNKSALLISDIEVYAQMSIMALYEHFNRTYSYSLESLEKVRALWFDERKYDVLLNPDILILTRKQYFLSLYWKSF